MKAQKFLFLRNFQLQWAIVAHPPWTVEEHQWFKSVFMAGNFISIYSSAFEFYLFVRTVIVELKWQKHPLGLCFRFNELTKSLPFDVPLGSLLYRSVLLIKCLKTWKRCTWVESQLMKRKLLLVDTTTSCLFRRSLQFRLPHLLINVWNTCWWLCKHIISDSWVTAQQTRFVRISLTLQKLNY